MGPPQPSSLSAIVPRGEEDAAQLCKINGGVISWGDEGKGGALATLRKQVGDTK